MGTLRTELEQLATNFVSSVLAAMRTASLGDLAEQTTSSGGRTIAAAAPERGRPGGRRAAAPTSSREGAGGRRHRASPEEVTRQKEIALSSARALKPGFSKGDVMNKSGSNVNLGRALSLLVADGKLVKKGDRRMTRYWVK